MRFDVNSLTMTEIIRLQNQLSQELTRRFERSLALAFSDIVGSTPYFARFGNEAGRKLHQRYYDLLTQSITPYGGRIVDTAGDGAFSTFSKVDAAADALIELQKLLSAENAQRERDHQIQVRIGIHWGRVLTDGQHVTGEAVNLCARVVGTSSPGEVRLSKDAFLELGSMEYRMSCKALGQVVLKGVDRPIELLSLEWRDRSIFPSMVSVEETGQTFDLPLQDLITFGRLKPTDGVIANDIVLALPDSNLTRQISRWHFELRRQEDGFQLRSVSDQRTEVDGRLVPKGNHVKVKPGSIVRLGGAITLKFLSPPNQKFAASDFTIVAPTATPKQT
jgi:class 3 adenylate cyclase